ncbi:MAG: MFS transporter [Candidatus Izemoplasmatales bacterium]|uniref:MFS transporter n=1 Tax=Hujiaoplasma nucleasis TaxID=2725268 RepID=A0A7L6N6E0_9MOLU|nr:MFS transporter [Hujiaoplasma nucleasis]QLY40827.1 MFS transporter [Hujiaoplasma nucleasis]
MKQEYVYYMIRALTGLTFHMMFTAAGLYRIDIAQMEIYQLILIGTALEIAIFIFEVPTGIIADLKSRKLSIVIGMFVISIGILIEPLTPIFIVIFISQVIFGFGYTFISGALDSWISDETEIASLEKIIITGSQFYKLTSVIGIVLAALIGMINIKYPLYLSSFIFLFLGLFSLIFMKEVKFKKDVKIGSFYKKYYGQLMKGFSHIKNHKILRIMFVIMLFYGLFSEGIDRTYELHILDGLNFRTIWNIPAIWTLSIVSGLVAIAGYIMLYVVKKRINQGNLIYIWSLNFTVMMIVGIIIFAYAPRVYFALFGYIFFSVSREATHPLLNSILLKNTPSKIKATVLSSFGQLDAIGQLLSGGLMVLISFWLNIKGLYLVTALLLVVPLISFIKLINQKHHERSNYETS